MVSRVQQAVGRATDTVRAWDAVTASTREFKLAGTDTLDSFRTTLAVARGELRRFSRNKDVMVAVEIGREYVDEAWIRARQQFNNLAARSGLKVAASVVSSTTGDAAGVGTPTAAATHEADHRPRRDGPSFDRRARSNPSPSG